MQPRKRDDTWFGKFTMSARPEPVEGRVFPASCLGFPIRKEVRVDEGVDDSLVCGIDRLELNAHAHATIAPRDVPFRVDVALRSGHPETR